MENLERLFKGLSDQTRLRILNLLLHGELCVCDIQYVLASSQPNVSRHLTYLKSCGLVLDRREGTRIYYRLAQTQDPIHKRLFGCLRDLVDTSAGFVEDSQRLRKAVESGACTAGEWRPYSALREQEASRT